MHYPKDLDANKRFRLEVILKAKENQKLQCLLLEKCRQDIVFFVNVFCWTYDPRVEPSTLPFITYEYQDETLLSLVQSIEQGGDVFIEKSRDMGMSWMLVVLQVWGFLNGYSSLYGSYKQDYVDTKGDMDSHFERIRFVCEKLPIWLLPQDFTSTYMNISSQELGCNIAGDAGVNFGTGGRRKFVIHDEFPLWADDKKAFRKTKDITNCRVFGGCITKDSLILTKEGLEEIGACPEGYSPENKYVYGKGGFHLAKQRFGNGFSATKKITTTYGYTIEGTHNHKLLTPKGWKALEDLRVGDYVYVQYGQNIFGTRGNFEDFQFKLNKYQKNINLPNVEDLCYLVGLYIAEGNYDRKRVCITNPDVEVIDFLKRIGFRTRRDGIHHIINSTLLCSFLDWLQVGHGSKNKTLPKKILQLNKTLLTYVLQGMFDGDGCGMQKRKRITYKTTSHTLARTLQVLLLNYGIIAGISKKISKPSGKARVESLSYTLGASGHAAYVFQQEIGFRIKRKNIVIDNDFNNYKHYFNKKDFKTIKGAPNSSIYVEGKTQICRQYLEQILENNKNNDYDLGLAVAKVKDIQDGQNECFDFVVPDTKQYFANGFISHNTPEGKYNIYGMIMTNHHDYQHLDIKRIRLHWSLHPKKDEVWYEEQKNMRTKLDIAKELDISYEDSVTGAVYPEFTERAQFERCAYNPRLPLYTSWDFGRDMNVIVWYQKDFDENKVYVIDSYQVKDKPIEFMASFILGDEVRDPVTGLPFVYDDIEREIIARHKSWNASYAGHYGDPYNGDARTTNSRSSIKDTLANNYRIYITLKKQNTSLEERIRKTHLLLPRLIVNQDLTDFIQAIVQSRYPDGTRQMTSEKTKPIHNEFSHYRTALEYFADNEPPKIDSVEKPLNYIPQSATVGMKSLNDELTDLFNNTTSSHSLNPWNSGKR